MLAAFLGDQRRVSAELVEQVAVEMREEQVVPDAVQGSGGVAPRAVQSPIDLQRLLADPEAARTLANVGPGFDATRFEERLALLERTLSTTLNALSQLIGSAQQSAGGDGKEVATK